MTDLEPRNHLHNKQHRMRRRGCGAGPVMAVAAQVSAGQIPGISEIHRRSMAVNSVARLVWQVPRRACRLRSARVAWRAPGPSVDSGGITAAAGRCSSDVPSRSHGWRATTGELDAAGLSWASWDMIQKVRRADQAHCEATDARRTGRGFHAAGNGVSAGQRLFRWAGMGGL